jgi:hypothetical protein
LAGGSAADAAWTVAAGLGPAAELLESPPLGDAGELAVALGVVAGGVDGDGVVAGAEEAEGCGLAETTGGLGSG